MMISWLTFFPFLLPLDINYVLISFFPTFSLLFLAYNPVMISFFPFFYLPPISGICNFRFLRHPSYNHILISLSLSFHHHNFRIHYFPFSSTFLFFFVQFTIKIAFPELASSRDKFLNHWHCDTGLKVTSLTLLQWRREGQELIVAPGVVFVATAGATWGNISLQIRNKSILK